MPEGRLARTRAAYQETAFTWIAYGRRVDGTIGAGTPSNPVIGEHIYAKDRSVDWNVIEGEQH